MRVLVTGAASSGKSAWAEARAMGLAAPRTYVATMAPAGREAAARIRRHRELRRGKGFRTVELFGADAGPDPAAGPGAAGPSTAGAGPDVGALLDSLGLRGGCALVEDLGNLLANRLFSPDGAEVAPALALERAEGDLEAVYARFDDVVVVGCEVGCEGVDGLVPGGARALAGPGDPRLATERYVRLLGTLACRVARGSDEVVEVVASRSNYLRGGDALVAR
ncbi:MAG: bifunctional adenosylcobinamide kinase/adenosylcobinamide-phosphate guanylyltransferase [Olsenella sp.]|nr:bifunctional adenosylcobinamide kinase/adenosylcobinamide-phosphate guanylyltransferase [Olsenella sp.]